MKFLVQSTAVLDMIILPNTAETIEAPGGAGLYAMAGMKVWTDEVCLVTGVGADYAPRFAGWYRQNGLPMDGLRVKHSCTPQTQVRYAPDGTRTEIPLLGEAHYRHMEVTPKEMEAFCRGCSGMYLFRRDDLAFWQELLALKRDCGFALLWEISADAAVPEHLSSVRALAEQVDVFSINQGEAQRLLAVAHLDDAVNCLLSWNVPLIYLRLGSRGVMLLQRHRCVFVPSVPGITVVDATGGGNSSSGAALVGYCQGRSLEEIGAMGNVAASFCIAQWGVPARFDAALREKAHRRMSLILSMMQA